MTDILHGFIVSELLINFIVFAGDFPRPTQNLVTLRISTWHHHFLTLVAKMLTKLDILKQHSSNFREMTSGHYVSLYSFRDTFTVSQTTLVKLIIIAKFKDFQLFLACGNFANLRCQGYLYFDYPEKYFIVSYGVLIH